MSIGDEKSEEAQAHTRPLPGLSGRQRETGGDDGGGETGATRAGRAGLQAFSVGDGIGDGVGGPRTGSGTLDCSAVNGQMQRVDQTGGPVSGAAKKAAQARAGGPRGGSGAAVAAARRAAGMACIT